MSDFDGFLRIILENPDDDSARLVFADWLDEQGDQRGEFIRIQCALERLDEADPRREQAETRQWVLTQAYGRQWAGLIPPLVRDFRFRRGFVDEVHMLASGFIEHAEELFAAAPITHAVLYQSAQHIGRLSACPYLERLRTLDLKPEFSWRQNDYRAIQVDDNGLMTLAQSPHVCNLRKLDLSYNVISDAGLSRLANTDHLGQLKTLDVSHNEIGPNLIEFLNLPQFFDLEELYLGSNQIGDDAIDHFVQTRRPPNLRRLRLEANRLSSGGSVMLFVATCLSRLEHLYLDGNLLTGMSLMEMNIGPQLQLLSLNSTQLGDESLAELLHENGPRPSKLYLRHNGLTAAASGHLVRRSGSSGSPLSRFTHLDLGDNRFGSEGAKMLAASPDAAGLKVLELSGNHINNIGAEALLSSPYLQDIAELSLLDNPIDAEVAALLHQRFGHRLKIDAFEVP